MSDNKVLEEQMLSVPVGQLGIIALPGCEEMAQSIDRYIVEWRKERAIMENRSYVQR